MATEIKLPQISDGVKEVEIGEILVSVGDTIKAGDPLMQVQADKAATSVDSKHSGKITELKVSPGDTVPIGAVLALIEESNGSTKAADAEKPSPKTEKPKEPEKKQPPEEQPEKQTEPEQGNYQPTTQEPKKATVAQTEIARAPKRDSSTPPPASPSTRREARELGVDLGSVAGSGSGGRITTEDVRNFARELITTRSSQSNTVLAPGATSLPGLPDFSEFGSTDREKLSVIARKTAEHMSLCWQVIPHVTQHELVDITDLEEARQRFGKGVGKDGPKVTMTAIMVKASVILLREFEKFNSSLDTRNNELVLKKYYHIGIAVDTPAGLVVPKIRDADQKSILEIAAELTELAGKARDGKLGVADMQGGTFTITNLGGIGGTAFTPIVNYPEVAILGMSRSQKQLVLQDGKPVERLMLPLSLSYDHRVINGADAARFIVRLNGLLSDFMQLLVSG